MPRAEFANLKLTFKHVLAYKFAILRDVRHYKVPVTIGTDLVISIKRAEALRGPDRALKRDDGGPNRPHEPPRPGQGPEVSPGRPAPPVEPYESQTRPTTQRRPHMRPETKGTKA